MKQFSQLDNTSLLMEIGRRLAHLRVTSGVQQSELAVKAGMSRDALSRLENGAGGIRLDSFLSVMRVLGVLDSLALALPEPSLTPVQLVELEKRRPSLPKRVRTKKKVSAIKWGDEDG